MPSMTPEQTLAEWSAQLEALLARQRASGRSEPGLATPEMVAGKTGLQIFEAWLAGEMPAPHIGKTMDFFLVEVAHGRAVFQGTPQQKHYNPIGSVHGGWYATLLDSALGCAVHSSLPAERAYTTAEFSINIVRAATAQTGPLRAMGQVIHSGRQMATAEGRIVGPDGKLYAHATTTCLVFEPRPQGNVAAPLSLIPVGDGGLRPALGRL